MSVIESFWHPHNVPDDDDAAANRAMHWARLLNQVTDDPAGFGFVCAAAQAFAARVMKDDPTGPWAQYAELFLSDEETRQ